MKFQPVAVIFVSQFLRKANNSVGFYKMHSLVKAKTADIMYFTIAGEFMAAILLCPCFARGQQLLGVSLIAIRLFHKNAFQISNRRCFSSLHIIMAQLALRKADRYVLHIFHEKLRFAVGHYFCKFVKQVLCGMIFPQQYRQISQRFQITDFRWFYHVFPLVLTYESI